MVVQPSQRGLLMDGMVAMLRKSREFYQHKILIALVFFVLKFAWFLIKDSNQEKKKASRWQFIDSDTKETLKIS